MRNHKLKALSLVLLLLSGCSNTGNSGGTGAVPTVEEAVTLENPVRLDQLGVLPASNSSAASYLLQLANYSKDKYTLDSVRVIDLDTGKDSKLVSVASQACSTVSANGSCSIQLTPHTSHSADVKLEVNLKDKLGANTKLVQLIRVSGELSSNNGGIVMLNDVDRIVTEDGNYSLSIPVVLGESYDDIKASNGSLICNTDGYQKGSSCTYQVSGKVSGTSAVVSTRLEGIKAGKTATVQEANTKVEVAKGAHLLLSHGAKINYPESSTEITVYNSGNIQATSIAASVEANSGLEIIAAAANNCEATLVANDTCKVKVKIKGSNNGQAPVKIAYKDGTTDNTAQTNVRYKVAAATAGVTFTESSNNLANAIIGGKTREATITVKNTGNRTLEGISYYLAPAGSSGLTVVKGAENGCNLAGATLAANESCSLSVKYTPTAPQASKVINLVLNSKYTDQNGQSHALLSSHGLNYSAAKAISGNLVWSLISGKTNLVIVNDGLDSELATWELKNTLAADEDLPAKALNVGLVTPSTIDGLTVAPVDTKACPLTNSSIAGNSSCQYRVSYGPTRVTQSAIGVDLKAAYNFYGGITESSSANFAVASSPAPQPRIEVGVVISGTPVTGDGSQAAPWSFNAYHDKTISLTYTFSNTGSLKAEEFNVDIGNLPQGSALKNTDCPNGAVASELGLGAKCTAIIDIPDPELFALPNLVNGNLNSASLKLDLPYSYNYNNSIYRGQRDSKYVKFNRLWANILHITQVVSSTESAYVFGVQSKISGLDNAAKSYPITVTPALTHPIAGVTLTSCTIADASEDSCINIISLPKDKFINTSELLVTFKTLANGLDAKDAITSDHLVGSTIRIHNQTELENAFKGDTSGKLFVLENDIALTGDWIPVPELKDATFDGQGHKITNLNINYDQDDAGMFSIIGSNVTIKNLNLQGKVTSTKNNVGLLTGKIYGKIINISNSNFNSNVIGSNGVGGVIGAMVGNDISINSGGLRFESITIHSEVIGNIGVGGVLGAANSSSHTFKNVRINSTVNGVTEVGGLGGRLSYHNFHYVSNVKISTNVTAKPGGYSVGGVLGLSSGTLISNVDASFVLTSNDATKVGGIVGYFGVASNRNEILNVISKGSISTSINPTESPSRIAGITSAMNTVPVKVNNAVDLTTITYTNGTTTTNYVSSLTETVLNKYVNSGNVFYALPAGATYITAANPAWVATLTGNTAATQKTFLVSKGFDFTNTWTIKKDSANNDIIGIKEDSIPQFPKW